MAYRIGISQGYAVRDGAVAAGNEAMRNAGPSMIAGGRVATGVGVGGGGSDAPGAEAASHVRCGVDSVNASTTKTTRGVKAASMKAAGGTKAAAANMETSASATAETAAAMETATVETTTTATAVETTTATAVETATAATMKTTTSLRLGYA